jgi:hypothetical protein
MGDLPPVPRQPNATAEGSSRLEGRFERPTSEVGMYGFHQIREKVEGHEILDKAVDPYGVECLGHIK